MANVIKPKRRSASTAAPTTAQLEDGEIAVNSLSRTIYLRVASSVVAVANYFSGSYNDLTDKPDFITQTVTDGDTTHAPSEDAVFDALAGKLDVGTGTPGGIVGPLNVEGIVACKSTGSVIDFGGFAGQGSINMVFFGNLGSVRFRPAGRTTANGMGVSAAEVFPEIDNTVRCGHPSFRWTTVYAATGGINTSDAREKTEPRDLTNAEIACAAELARLPCIYQWLYAIEEKGDDARLHSSPTVQAVIACMESHSLDPFRYGFVCYDEWGETPEVRDEETGEVTQKYRPAGDRYSLRPTELAWFVMRGMAERQAHMEARLAAIGA